MFSIVTNHAFVDGNKRIGALVLLVLLELNGVNITYTQIELVDITLKIADGKGKANDILKWIERHKG